MSLLYLSYYLESLKKIVLLTFEIIDRVPKNSVTDFRSISSVLSHISTLVLRNSSKLSQYVTLVPILLSGEFKDNRIINI